MKHLAVLALLAVSSALWSQSTHAVPPTVRFDFSNPALIPANWTLELHPDGSGHFRSQRGNAPREDNSLLEPRDQDRDIQVSAAFAAHVFQVAAAERYFQMECESHNKVAFQGTKQLSYQGPQAAPSGAPRCVFNYSRDRQVQQLADSLLSVAATIVEGARIERLRKHDRLGLDQEMDMLSGMLADGRATEIGVIRNILESIAADDTLMERVRRRAREFLTKAGSSEQGPEETKNR